MAAVKPIRLIVATYNVLADAYIRPEFYPLCDVTSFSPEARHPRLIERVAGLGADIICLQEVDYPMFVKLQRRLDAEGYRGRWAHKESLKKDGCATFVRTSLRQLGSCILGYEDGGVGTAHSGHVALVTMLDAGESGLAVVNTHLKWDPPGTDVEKQLGLTQAKLLMSVVGRSMVPSIICGDFNAEHGSDVMQVFADAGFTDAHDARTSTCVANGRSQKIDHLLFETGLSAEPVPAVEVTAQTPLPSDTEPSDHVPLTAVVHLEG